VFIGKYNGQDAVARKLTPSECLRLMGFENFKIVNDDGIMYRQSGNSIAVPVLKAIVNKILEAVSM
jgi:DNA (cytosine-5)-methyltransferase 1